MCRILRYVSTLVAIVLLMLQPAAALAAQHCYPGNYHVSTDPTREVFTFGGSAGLLPSGAVSIYGDGHVRATGTMHVQNPNLTLDRDTLAGLLTLAEAERFFELPGHISCRTRATDLRIRSITIQTTAETHSVDVLSVCRTARFQQLYRVLVLTTGTIDR